MNSRWLSLIIFLIVIITAVTFMSPRRERGTPEVGELLVLDLGDDRLVRIQGRLLRDHRQAYYYQVEQADEIIQPTAFFGTLPPGSPLLSFVWYFTDDNQRVAIAAEHQPAAILIIHDFNTSESWPAHDGHEMVEAFQARGQTMLQPLQAAHTDKNLTLHHAEAQRPLPPPPPPTPD